MGKEMWKGIRKGADEKTVEVEETREYLQTKTERLIKILNTTGHSSRKMDILLYREGVGREEDERREREVGKDEAGWRRGEKRSAKRRESKQRPSILGGEARAAVCRDCAALLI